MKKNIDVLVLARPDHSYGIYQELEKSNGLKYLFCSFKILPQWMKKIIKSPRARFYGKGYSNCLLLTFLHIYRLRRNKPQLEKYEKSLFQFHLRHLLPFIKPKMIHYWPNFTMDVIAEYKHKHPEVKTYAEVYFPCEQWVIDNIKPLFNKYNLDSNMSKIEKDAENLKRLMEFEDNFLVPSKFVADTYRQYYPNKNYILHPFGITKWDKYKKKAYKDDINKVKSFVYAGGGITIEKGCDDMFEYFKEHPELDLHIYGAVPSNQKHIFDKYEKLENIHYYGFVPKSELQDAIGKYDVGILLSRFDAYSLAVGELLGAGLPVIVSDKTGIFFQIEDYELGIVTALNKAAINKSFSDIMNPVVYNKILDNLDNYLSTPHESYAESTISFYKEQIGK